MIRYIGMGNMYSSLLFSLPPREGLTTHDHLLVSRGDAAGPNGTSECVERLLGRIDAPGFTGGIKATRQQSCVVRSSCSVACWIFFHVRVRTSFSWHIVDLLVVGVLYVP